MALLIGWQFTVAEFVGCAVMIVVVALALRQVTNERLVSDARKQSEQGLAGSMEGHAAMEMSVTGDGSFLHRR